jgi:hypothetical protein
MSNSTVARPGLTVRMRRSIAHRCSSARRTTTQRKARTRAARRTAFSLAVGATLCTSAVALAPAAHAGTDNYIKITNKAGIVATACYQWRGVSSEKDYCTEGRPVGESWKAYFPENATSAVVDLKLSKWDKVRDSAPAKDASKNHCFEIRGLLGSENLTETGC